eukprot:scaffold43085_cov216-Skeletonema_dohrnii-CCMP3373.AAC.1
MSTKQRAEAATATKEEKEEVIGALIYRESQLRKREAAAAKKNESNSSASKHRATSTHKTTIRGDSSFATPESRQLIEKRKRHLPAANEGKEPAKKVTRKKYRYECYADGCTNNVVKGGVCWRHGAKDTAKVKHRKRCSSEGCTNQVRKGGLCKRHGAKRKRWSNDRCTNSAEIRGVCMGQRDMIESEDARNMDHHLKVKVTRRR